MKQLIEAEEKWSDLSLKELFCCRRHQRAFLLKDN